MSANSTQHQREVEAGEHRRVHRRERREQRAAAGEQPHLVAVPHRPDGVAHDRLVLLGLAEERVEHADAQVEAVEHRVAGEQHADEHEPDDAENFASHRVSLP